jgi:hypothetical protein
MTKLTEVMKEEMDRYEIRLKALEKKSEARSTTTTGRDSDATTRMDADYIGQYRLVIV